jgi:hypothetical protein
MRLLQSIHIPQSFQRMAPVFKSILAHKRIQMDNCDPPMPSWEKTAAITKEIGADKKGCVHLVYLVVVIVSIWLLLSPSTALLFVLYRSSASSGMACLVPRQNLW